MGWSSATELFDGAVDVALTFIPKTKYDSYTQPPLSLTHDPKLVAAVVERMYTSIDWNDWDTQDESKYFEPYLRDVMVKLGEIEGEDD